MAVHGLLTGILVSMLLKARAFAPIPFGAIVYRPLLARNAEKGDYDAANREVADRLKVEALSPFRPVRMFFYGSAGIGAGLGGFTALTQLAASLANAPNALPISDVGTNLAVDVGVVVTAIVLFRLDQTKGEESSRTVAARERRSRLSLSKGTMASREAQFALLRLLVVDDSSKMRAGTAVTATEAHVGDVVTRDPSAGGSTTVGEVQRASKQHVVVVCGPKLIVREALKQARAMGGKIARAGILIVPVDLAAMDGSASEVENRGGASRKRRSEGGFGKGELTDEAYVARPDLTSAGAAEWRSYLRAELASATEQRAAAAAVAKASSREQKSRTETLADATFDTAYDGIVIVANKEGKVVRRGLGVPAWEALVDELSDKTRAKGGK